MGDGVTKAAVERDTTVAGGIRRGTFPAKPATDRCSACDLRRVCRHAPEACRA